MTNKHHLTKQSNNISVGGYHFFPPTLWENDPVSIDLDRRNGHYELGEILGQYIGRTVKYKVSTRHHKEGGAGVLINKNNRYKIKGGVALDLQKAVHEGKFHGLEGITHIHLKIDREDF